VEPSRIELNTCRRHAAGGLQIPATAQNFHAALVTASG
jgi:hypothetical protein